MTMTNRVHSIDPAGTPIMEWLDHLRGFVPPRHVTVIGAGDGRGPWVQWLLRHEFDTALTFVEADEHAADELRRLLVRLAAAPGGGEPKPSKRGTEPRVLQATVAPDAGPATFYTASLRAESGLIDPNTLQSLWPNLYTLMSRQEQMCTLAGLLDGASTVTSTVISAREPPVQASPPDKADGQLPVDIAYMDREPRWLLLDCLPAAAILAPAVSRLASFDVVLARVLLDTPSEKGSKDPAGATLAELDKLLAGVSMRLLVSQIGRHPRVGYALFVRDLQSTLRVQAVEFGRKMQAARRAEEVQKKIAKDSQAAASAEIKSRKEQLTRLRHRTAVALQALAGARSSLKAERNAHKAHLTALQLERDADVTRALGAQQILQAELARFRRQYVDLSEKLTETRANEDALRSLLSEMRREHGLDKQAALIAHRAAAVNHERWATVCENQRTRYLAEIYLHEQLRNALERELGEVHRRLAKKNEYIARFEKNHRSGLSGLIPVLHAQQLQVAELRAEISEIRSQLSATHEAYRSKFADLLVSRSELDFCLKSVQSEQDSLKHDLAVSNETLRSATQELKDTTAVFRKQVQAHDDELAALRRSHKIQSEILGDDRVALEAEKSSARQQSDDIAARHEQAERILQLALRLHAGLEQNVKRDSKSRTGPDDARSQLHFGGSPFPACEASFVSIASPWSLSDCRQLAAIDRGILSDDPSRVELALAAVIASFKIGNHAAAAQVLSQACTWGPVRKSASQYLHLKNQGGLVSDRLAQHDQQTRNNNFAAAALPPALSASQGGSSIGYKNLLSDETQLPDAALLLAEQYASLSTEERVALLERIGHELVPEYLSPDLPPLALAMPSHESSEYVLVHVRGDYIPQTIIDTGRFYEARLLGIISQLYVPGTLVVDAGANIGNHTLYFSAVMGASVLAFEPHPLNHALLHINLHINHVHPQVEVRRLALGVGSGFVNLVQALAENYGSFTAQRAMAAAGSAGREGDGVRVRVEALDVQLEGVEHEVSILKIDTEGMEFQILIGARRIIEAYRPAIVVECRDVEAYEAVSKYLAVFGYCALDYTGATPTFVFACLEKQSHQHVVGRYLEKAIFRRIPRNHSFNAR